MADNADADLEEKVDVEQLTPEEASRIIHSHRKVRYGMCYHSVAFFSPGPNLMHPACMFITNTPSQGPPAGPVGKGKSSVTTSNLARTASKGSIRSSALTSQTALRQARTY